MNRLFKVTFLGFVSLLLNMNCTKPHHTIAIGHRGAAGHVAENTVESIKKGMELGADMVEFDVYKVDGDEIVLMHDDRLERTTNGIGFVEDKTFFQLMQFKVEGKYRIPMLQDALKAIDKKIKINVELKGKNTADRVAHILKAYVIQFGWSYQDYLVSSFNWNELRDLHIYNDKIPIAILVDGDPLQALPIAEELSAIAINPSYENLTEELVETIHDKGYLVYTWTVNEPEDIARMKEWGVDGIFSDYPERVNP